MRVVQAEVMTRDQNEDISKTFNRAQHIIGVYYFMIHV